MGVGFTKIVARKKTGKSAAFPESRVVKLWQDYLPGRTDLVTEGGGPVEIVYPGRLNDGRGADLCDAVITTGRGLQKGDIEVHVRSSSWWGHRHHQDPLYNRVILHVVYWHDVAAAVTLQDGREVPTLALGKYMDTAGRDNGAVSPLVRRSMPCRERAGRSGSFIGGVLDAAGDRRFMARAAEFHEALSFSGAPQALYEGIMGALGYSRNKLPMLKLARGIPLSRLGAAAGLISPDECLVRYQSLLLGTASLLPSQVGRFFEETRADAWIGRLESTWMASGGAAAMSPVEWYAFKVRPGNLPRRRIAAMSYLLCRYRPEGLLPVLVHELENASLDKRKGGLEECLMVGAEGYWFRNMDFGMPAHRIVPALLGADRAEVIVVNVWLPFAVAWGQAASRPGLAEKALELYRLYPPMAENTLERHMRRQLGISRCAVSSARRQQGIIHIFKTLCSQGRCGECPLS